MEGEFNSRRDLENTHESTPDAVTRQMHRPDAHAEKVLAMGRNEESAFAGFLSRINSLPKSAKRAIVGFAAASALASAGTAEAGAWPQRASGMEYIFRTTVGQVAVETGIRMGEQQAMVSYQQRMQQLQAEYAAQMRQLSPQDPAYPEKTEALGRWYQYEGTRAAQDYQAKLWLLHQGRQGLYQVIYQR